MDLGLSVALKSLIPALNEVVSLLAKLSEAPNVKAADAQAQQVVQANAAVIRWAESQPALIVEHVVRWSRSLGFPGSIMERISQIGVATPNNLHGYREEAKAVLAHYQAVLQAVTIVNQAIAYMGRGREGQQTGTLIRIRLQGEATPTTLADVVASARTWDAFLRAVADSKRQEMPTLVSVSSGSVVFDLITQAGELVESIAVIAGTIYALMKWRKDRAATEATPQKAHLDQEEERRRLIKAMADQGGLDEATIAAVLAQVQTGTPLVEETIEDKQEQLVEDVAGPFASEEDKTRVRQLLREVIQLVEKGARLEFVSDSNEPSQVSPSVALANQRLKELEGAQPRQLAAPEEPR